MTSIVQRRLLSHTPIKQCLPACWSRFVCVQCERNRVRAAAAQIRSASSASSTRWKTRQSRDHFAKEAKVKGLMSRAAFKLLEVNDKHKLFKPGDTVIDLGYAPGSWSQVAVSKTQPNGRVIGIDVIPAQPPRGVSTIQGDFLDLAVQAEVRAYVRDPGRGRPKRPLFHAQGDEPAGARSSLSVEELEDAEKSYIDLERQTNANDAVLTDSHASAEGDTRSGRVVDVVLSDMSAPWHLISGQWIKSISNPHRRMMNTSGIAFRDHAGSMDLCLAALRFSVDVLKVGGHFVCKFYQGAEEKALESKLKAVFDKVHREKPEASRDASKEAYFVALRRKNVGAEVLDLEDG